MKLGCCINMLADKIDVIGSRYIPVLKEAGYDYVEMPLSEMMELPDNEFIQLVKKVEASGLPCLCSNNFFPAAIRLTGPNADMQAVDRYVKAAVERASCLGVEKIVFGSGKAKNIPEGFPYEKAFKQVLNVLRIVDNYITPKQISVVIEPLNKEESNLILNLSEAENLMKQAGCKSVYQLVDYYHFIKEEDSYHTLKTVVNNIRHVHFAEPIGRVFPVRRKEEYITFFLILKENGYNDTVSIEAYSSIPEQDISKACFIKEYFK